MPYDADYTHNAQRLPWRLVSYQVGFPRPPHERTPEQLPEPFHPLVTEPPGALLESVKRDADMGFGGGIFRGAFGSAGYPDAIVPAGVGWLPHPDVIAAREWLRARGGVVGFYEGSTILATLPAYSVPVLHHPVFNHKQIDAVEWYKRDRAAWEDHIFAYGRTIGAWEPDFVVIDVLNRCPDIVGFCRSLRDAFADVGCPGIEIIGEPDTDHADDAVKQAVREAGVRSYRIMERRGLTDWPHRPTLDEIRPASGDGGVGRRLYQLGTTYTGTKEEPVHISTIVRDGMAVNAKGHDLVVQDWNLRTAEG